MQAHDVIQQLKSLSCKKTKQGMSRFGVKTDKALGISMPQLRSLAKELDKDQILAQKLWESGIHEAQILASLLGQPDKITSRQMNSWVKDFDSWDVCDQVCQNLFRHTPFVDNKIMLWAPSEEEFVRRTAFALIAVMAVHGKSLTHEQTEAWFDLIKKTATDERNFVKKAVNWALRQLGKRDMALNKQALAVAQEIAKIDSKSARWIAQDAIRELAGQAVQQRLAHRLQKK